LTRRRPTELRGTRRFRLSRPFARPSRAGLASRVAIISFSKEGESTLCFDGLRRSQPKCAHTYSASWPPSIPTAISLAYGQSRSKGLLCPFALDRCAAEYKGPELRDLYTNTPKSRGQVDSSPVGLLDLRSLARSTNYPSTAKHCRPMGNDILPQAPTTDSALNDDPPKISMPGSAPL